MRRKITIAVAICATLILASGTIAYAEEAGELISEVADAIENVLPDAENQESETTEETWTEENAAEYTDEEVISEEVPYTDQSNQEETDNSAINQGETTTCYGSGYADELADQLFDETNAYRQAHQMPTLSRMEDASYADTRCMEITYQWSHERPGGQASECYGENLAKTSDVTSAHSVVYDLWANSEFHNMNMLDSGYTAVAVSVYVGGDGQTYYVQCFY